MSPGSVPVELVKELGKLLSGESAATGTQDECERINGAVSQALDLPLDVAQRVSWKLIQQASTAKDQEDGERRPFAAARHLLGTVIYPPGLDELIPDMPSEVDRRRTGTIRELQDAGFGSVSFRPFAPSTQVGQRRLLAALAGGYGESRYALIPRAKGGRALDGVARALWGEVLRLIADPAVVDSLVEQARRELEAIVKAEADALEAVVDPVGRSSPTEDELLVKGLDAAMRAFSEWVPLGDDSADEASIDSQPSKPGRPRRIAVAAILAALVVAATFVFLVKLVPTQRDEHPDDPSSSSSRKASPSSTSSPQPSPSPDESTYYVAGWGPQRRVFSLYEDGGSPYPAFNGIFDNPDFGDERNFVGLASEASWRGKVWSDDVWAEPGDTLYMRTYVNNSGSDLAEVMPAGRIQDARLRIGISRGLREYSVFSTLEAVNATSVWDGSRIHVDDGVEVAFVPGTAHLDSNAFPNGGLSLSDQIFDGGVKLGYRRMDGVIRPGYRYSLYITVRISVTRTSANADVL